MMQRHLAATTGCGVVITGAAIACAVLLAHILAALITDPTSRTLGHWSVALWVLLALFIIRTVAQWAQARLSQRGATAAIADLSAQLLATVTALPPRELAKRRDEAAALITRGLDGLRPYYTRYLPAVIQAAVLTPAAVVTMACFDLQAAGIV
ncbi:MAG: ATPase and permease component of ABC-type transporter involved in cytochrome bd biosynthesis, partial [Mycobacterium sp.]|nr:ATPase and permease component of ABC-type transporter involved in cytochrome bd biosynthesis [Mycobacterium sp.]